MYTLSGLLASDEYSLTDPSYSPVVEDKSPFPDRLQLSVPSSVTSFSNSLVDSVVVVVVVLLNGFLNLLVMNPVNDFIMAGKLMLWLLMSPDLKFNENS